MAGPARAPHPARLAARLEVLDGPDLDDDAEWDGVEVAGDLSGRSACDLEIVGSRVIGAQLTGSTLDRLRVVDTVFERCDLSGTVIDSGAWSRVELRDCRMSGFAASRVELRDVRFSGCRLDEASFRMTHGERVVFESCDLRGADFYETALQMADLVDCDLTGARFGRAELRGARLHGSRLDDLVGAAALAGVVIDSAQVTPLAYGLIQALDIVVDDDATADRS
jgi:uncharacterized protein YjbI with pentapeptide repeats